MSSKLDAVENVDAKLSDWVERGHSLKRIAGELKNLGVQVTDMTVQRRIRALGLVTKNEPIARKTGEGAWLSQYRDEIVGLADAGNTYSEIWDRLAAAHPSQPRLQRELSRDAKTSAIAAWVHAERKRAARQRRGSLLAALPAAGAAAPQYVIVQGGLAETASKRAPRQPAAAPAGQLVRPGSMVPVPPAAISPLRTERTAGGTGEPTFDMEARRRETEAMLQSQRAQEAAATTPEQKAKAARLLERFKTNTP